MQPRPDDRDLDFVGRRRGRLDADEPILQMEKPQQIDEVALEKTPPAQVLELAADEAQAA